MNGSDFYGTALTDAVAAGRVSQATLDGHVRRILTAMFASGLFDTTQTGTITTPVSTDAHRTTARQVAEEGSVLLKNASAALPLGSANKKIAVIGDDAGPNAMTAGGGSTHVGSSSVVTPYSALVTRAGSGASVNYPQGYASPSGEIVDSPYLTPSSGSGHGLHGQFYNGTSMGRTPVLSRVDPTLNFLWGGASPGRGIRARAPRSASRRTPTAST
ncbi:glycoside hydrolase family 3 C-terminal domain-containing protein [Streptomyces sp. NPDC008139]|uniref:glycoside hydrolase family 3 C-terminal domain-containing protein n=1 Tax=Streptomyces sp. NPDC008139 TaxID=3364814 RepID=UPI0036E261DC